MKITDLEFQNKIEVSVNKKQQKEYKLIGSYVPKIDGYRIFEYNLETKVLRPAQFRTSYTYILGGTNKKILDANKGCVYIEALNEKNAVKRLLRGDVFFAN